MSLPTDDRGRTHLTVEERRRRTGYTGRSGNDDALYDRSGGCSRCGAGAVYFEGLCVDCFEDMGGDGPGRDSMG